MNYIFHGETIDYDYINNHAETTILLLHGWGGNKYSFSHLISLTKSKYNILTLTMPTTKTTSLVWDILDYRILLQNIINCHNIKSVVIICHSFGFRVATMLAKFVNVDKIVITGGAGIKNNSIFKKIKSNECRILLNNPKFKNLYNIVASKDYIELSKTNKETFKNIVNFNTKNYTHFNCPILLFWGKFDQETPMSIMKKINSNKSTKKIITKSEHFAYLNESELFKHEVLEFLKCEL